MSTHNLDECDPRLLAKVIGLASSQQRAYRPEELAAILQDRLSAPVEFDMSAFREGVANRLKSLSSGEGLLLKSFRDLFEHPNPPVELLDVARLYAKACSMHPESHLPPQVAKALYFASIAVAMVRCGGRITSLDREKLAASFRWFEKQPWVDQGLRTIFGEALRLVSREGGETS